MKLFTLLYGKSKKRMKPIMVDSFAKCENYRDARGARMGGGWHDIVPGGDSQWRQKSCTIGGNKYESGTGNRNGYIGKNGFNPHT